MESSNDLRGGLKAAAEIGASDARSKAAGFSSRAAQTIRATSSGNRAYIVGGKAVRPWYAWADFGSRTPRRGNSRSVGPWKGSGKGPEKGRFIYPAIDDQEPQIVAAIELAVFHALQSAGF